MSLTQLRDIRNRVNPSLTVAPVRELTNHGGFGSTEKRPAPKADDADARERTEGSANDGALDPVEQQRVVDDADAALRHPRASRRGNRPTSGSG